MSPSNPGRSGAPRRRLGRPPRLSRESIIEACLALLERAPHEPLTVARIAAEEYGVSSANAERVRARSTRAAVRRLLGAEGDLGARLGLSPDWAFRVVTQVGSYGESFDRHLGVGSAIKLPRGLNAVWTEGGLMYAMPFR